MNAASTVFGGYAPRITLGGRRAVMTGPGNGIADADRERVIETLKVAFVQERLTKEELDARIGSALGARSGAELAVLTADLPGGLAAAPPPAREARLSKEVRDGLRVIGSLYLIAAILWLSALLAGQDVVGAAMAFTAVMTAMVALFASLHGVAVLVSARHRVRSGRPLPPAELRSPPASCAGPFPGG
jgi:DUF1707 SHOCT-like domain